MEIQGKIIQILPEQTGEGRNGTWRKNRFVIETSGQYPKKVCIDVWGDKFDQMSLAEEQFVTASIDVESREWQGKWFTDVKAWKVEQGGGSPQPQASNEPFYAQPQTAPTTAASPQDTSSIPAGNEPPAFEDDLPF
ncbi:MAG: DUF3127 domain-containing protein [Saprospiraceae bacterium]|nr:DUF3127 domain-containing protein [Saprospiraceae bacterium]